MTSPHRHFHRLAWLACAFAVCVIVFGGFVRLSNAGLSCPDWPTCYGQATWPSLDQELLTANEAFPERRVERHKAWREQVHRHLAATLGLLVLGLALLAVRQLRFGRTVVVAASALIAASILVYMQGWTAPSSMLAACGLLLLLVAALRWAEFARLATLALAVVVFQAILGMWTVTWLLKPIVVLAHLLGGLATFAVLVFMAWRATPGSDLIAGDAARLRRWTAVGLIVVIVQIALGGWTSANYASMACGMDFPKCAGQWWPSTDFREAFVLWRGIGVDYEGGVLDGSARAAIHLSHRLLALLVLGQMIALAWRLGRSPGLGGWGAAVVLVVFGQVVLGISNVVFALPLAVAVAHLAGAVLLLYMMAALMARLRPP